MKKSFLSTVLILIGLVLLTYPKTEELYTAYQQQKLLSEWQQSLAIIDAEAAGAVAGDASATADTDTITVEQVAEQEQKLREAYIQKHLEGILTIEKINLNLPILKGATKENLDISVASLENTGKAGAVGNYALAAHRSHPYGQNFNRLDELEVGDRVEVDTGETIYRYTVVTKLYVKPEETWVLSSTREAKEITLITCHPMIKPTQRLIIKGELSEQVNTNITGHR